MGDENFEEFGGDAIRTLATFALHFTKEFKHHALRHSAEGEVFSRVMGGGIAQMPRHPQFHIIKSPGKFRPTLAKKTH